ncbi:hypothetical protein QBC43DRAFT_338230 [Cladorrhinum sp. PSN259]|nr:hypothetical protein QBC43DRAFT_338230 [Cladorrhinum sp. PSN259]
MLPKLSFVAAAVGLWVSTYHRVAADAVSIFGSFYITPNCEPLADLLDTWYDESYDMAEAAVAAMNNYANDVDVQKAVTTFFGIKPTDGDAGRKAILTHLRQVFSFLNQNNANLLDFRQPWLFCNHDFMIAKDKNDAAFDQMGRPIPDPADPTKHKTIYEMFTTKLTKNKNPYWMQEINEYTFDSVDMSRYCDDPENSALTWDVSPRGADPGTAVPLMMICPNAFTDRDYYDPMPGSDKVTAGSRLQNYQPRSITFLHEMFHLVRGREVLSGKAEAYTIDGTLELARSDAVQARKNPETLAFFGLAMYHLGRGSWDFSDPSKAVKLAKQPSWGKTLG